MTVQYTISEEDHITFQLYTASKSERIKKQRRNRFIRVPIVYIILSILLAVVLADIAIALFFATVAVLWLLLYPVWERRNYVKHYTEVVKEQKVDSNKLVTLELNNDSIQLNSDTSESKISTGEVASVNEIDTLIIIKLNNGSGILIPKHSLAEPELLRNQLQSFSKHLQIPYHLEYTWKWK